MSSKNLHVKCRATSAFHIELLITSKPCAVLQRCSPKGAASTGKREPAGQFHVGQSPECLQPASLLPLAAHRPAATGEVGTATEFSTRARQRRPVNGQQELNGGGHESCALAVMRSEGWRPQELLRVSRCGCG